MKSTILKYFISITIVFAFQAVIGHNSTADDIYVKTPADMEGPFYPVEHQADEDNDLTLVHGRPARAKGQILNLSGIVIDTEGRPQKEVTIEIWQTDSKGLYRHPNDTNPGKRDNNFQYWGKTVTKDDGKFFFKTIIPGEYHPRPAHIHFNVWKNGKLLLTSQIYISSDKNSKGLLKLELTPAGSGVFEGFFRIVI